MQTVTKRILGPKYIFHPKYIYLCISDGMGHHHHDDDDDDDDDGGGGGGDDDDDHAQSIQNNGWPT